MRAAVKQARLDLGPSAAPAPVQTAHAPALGNTDADAAPAKITLPKGVVLLKWTHPAPGWRIASHCMYDPPPHGVARVIVDGARLSARDLIVRRHARSGDIGIFATINGTQTLMAVLDGIEVDVLRDALQSLI